MIIYDYVFKEKYCSYFPTSPCGVLAFSAASPPSSHSCSHLSQSVALQVPLLVPVAAIVMRRVWSLCALEAAPL